MNPAIGKARLVFFSIWAAGLAVACAATAAALAWIDTLTVVSFIASMLVAPCAAVSLCAYASAKNTRLKLGEMLLWAILLSAALAIGGSVAIDSTLDESTVRTLVANTNTSGLAVSVEKGSLASTLQSSAVLCAIAAGFTYLGCKRRPKIKAFDADGKHS